MGTRSITHIHEMNTLDEKEKIVCTFFRHYDGYPSGHGKDLAEWLKDRKLINGIGGDFNKTRDYNRAGTMAVKLMNHIQDESSCEVFPTGPVSAGQDFDYHIYFRDNEFVIKVDDAEKEIEVLACQYNADDLEKFFYGESE